MDLYSFIDKNDDLFKALTGQAKDDKVYKGAEATARRCTEKGR